MKIEEIVQVSILFSDKIQKQHSDECLPAHWLNKSNTKKEHEWNGTYCSKQVSQVAFSWQSYWSHCTYIRPPSHWATPASEWGQSYGRIDIFLNKSSRLVFITAHLSHGNLIGVIAHTLDHVAIGTPLPVNGVNPMVELIFF